MSSEKAGPPPSYDTVGGQPGYPQSDHPPQTGYSPQAGYQPGYPPPGNQPPHQGYPGQYGQAKYVPQGGQPYTTQQVIITQPGHPGVLVTQPRPPDYMIPSVLACFCCFWPTGLCAIYYASQANSLARTGDMESAQRYSNTARTLMIVSIVIGFIWIILTIVLRVVVYSTSSSSSYYG